MTRDPSKSLIYDILDIFKEYVRNSKAKLKVISAAVDHVLRVSKRQIAFSRRKRLLIPNDIAMNLIGMMIGYQDLVTTVVYSEFRPL